MCHANHNHIAFVSNATHFYSMGYDSWYSANATIWNSPEFISRLRTSILSLKQFQNFTGLGDSAARDEIHKWDTTEVLSGPRGSHPCRGKERNSWAVRKFIMCIVKNFMQEWCKARQRQTNCSFTAIYVRSMKGLNSPCILRRRCMANASFIILVAVKAICISLSQIFAAKLLQ